MSLFRALSPASSRILLLATLFLIPAGPAMEALQPSDSDVEETQRSEGAEDTTPVPTGSVQLVKLTSVEKGRMKSGAAAQLALEPGDMVYAINGKPVTSVEQMQAYIKGEHVWGEVIRLRYLRGSQAYEIADMPTMVLGGFITAKAKLEWGGEFASATIDVPASTAQRGVIRQQRSVLLKTVAPGGLGDKAGLKAGDILLTVEGKLVNTYPHLQYFAFDKKGITTLHVVGLRDGKEIAAELPAMYSRSWGMKGDSQIATLPQADGSGAAEQTVAAITSQPAAGKTPLPEQPIAPKSAAAAITARAATSAVTIRTEASSSVASDVIPVPLVMRGWTVSSVVPDGPAARAGLRSGDFIVHVNGWSGGDNKTIPQIMAQFKPGEELSLRIYRGNEFMVLPIKTGNQNGSAYLGVAASGVTEQAIPNIHWPVVPMPEAAPGLQYPALQSVMVPAWNLYRSVAATQPTRTVSTFIRLKRDWIAPGDLPCDGGPVDIAYAGDASSFARLVRLQAPTCNRGVLTSPGIVVEPDGHIQAGQITMYKGNLLPKVDRGLDVDKFGSIRFYSGGGVLAGIDKAGNMLLAKDPQQPMEKSGAVLGYLSLRKAGYFEAELWSSKGYDLAKTRVFHGDGYTVTADKFSIFTQTSDKEPAIFFRGSPYVISATGVQRYDTTMASEIGPAGTYYYAAPQAVGLLPKGAVPAPGTLAQYAREAGKCPYKPAIPEGFLHWADGCTSEKIEAYSIDGQFAISFEKGKPVKLLGFDPDRPGGYQRRWEAAGITQTNPPLPTGRTAVFDGRGTLVFRGNLLGYNPDGEGECPIPNSKDVEPCTFQDGKRTDIAFLARERQAQLDAAAARQQQQATASMAAAQQQREADAARQAEVNRIAEQQRLAEEAAERREEEAQSRARWAATFNNMANTIAQSQAEVAANQQRAENLRNQQAAAQARAQQQRQDADAAYRRQQVQNINAATAKQDAIAGQYAQKRASEQQAQQASTQNDAMARALAAQRAASQQTSTPAATGRTSTPSGTSAANSTATQPKPRGVVTYLYSQSIRKTEGGKMKTGSCYTTAMTIEGPPGWGQPGVSMDADTDRRMRARIEEFKAACRTTSGFELTGSPTYVLWNVGSDRVGSFIQSRRSTSSTDGNTLVEIPM